MLQFLKDIWGYGYVQINVVQFNTFNLTTIVSSGGPMKVLARSDSSHRRAIQELFSSVSAGRNLKQNTYFN
jgi:hypothetical protein